MTRERLYRLYVVALVGCVLAGPGVYAVATSLSVPPLLDLLRSPWAPAAAAAAVGLLLLGALGLGRTLGPVLGDPFRMQVLAGGPAARRRSLRPRFRMAAAAVVGVAAVAGAVPPLALVLAGGRSSVLGGDASVLAVEAGPWWILLGAVAGALVGVVTAVCWLAGQALGGRALALLATAVLGLGALAVASAAPAVPGALPGLARPAGPSALAGASAAPAVPLLLTLLALLLLATAAATCVPALLDRLRGPVLLEQASRWRAATTAGGAGDLAGALAAYRALPRRPPTLPALSSTARRPCRAPALALVVLRRDLVGISRTPGRLAAALGGTVLAVVVAGAAALLPASLAWAALAGSAAWGFLALGSVSDGIRHAVEVMSAPTLYGVGDLHLLALHTLLPLALVLLAGGVGAAVTVLLGGNLLLALAGTAGLLLAVLVRVLDAAKGPMPLTLLTPTPTPMGDTSGLAVALWQVDALLVATIVPTAVALLSLSAGPAALLLHLPAAALVALAARRRLA